jgi:hypothetical protein
MIHAPNSYVSVTLAYNWHKITSFFINENPFILQISQSNVFDITLQIHPTVLLLSFQMNEGAVE